MPNVIIAASFERKARKLLARYPHQSERVQRTLALLAENPRHPSLATKRYDEQQAIRQSYVEANTPSAWRVWWVWANDSEEGHTATQDTIVVIGFGPHP